MHLKSRHYMFTIMGRGVPRLCTVLRPYMYFIYLSIYLSNSGHRCGRVGVHGGLLRRQLRHPARSYVQGRHNINLSEYLYVMIILIYKVCSVRSSTNTPFLQKVRAGKGKKGHERAGKGRE